MKTPTDNQLKNPIFGGIDATNPYYRAASLLLNRLKWDLNPQSWVSRSKINKFKNKYDGRKAVIMCNGPSLLKSDLSLLNNIYTFGLNKINLLFDSTTLRPSCIVSTNDHVLSQNRDFYNTTDIQLFLNSRALKQDVKARKNVIFFHSANIDRFARDCSFSLYEGYTVTFVALQLAFHMGFKQIALIGCDHNFKSKGPANMIVTADKNDENHFHKQYFSGGQNWELPDLERSELYYRFANNVYNAYNKKIFNATIGGELEVFERISLEDFIARKDESH